MKAKSKLRKTLNIQFDEYMSVNLNGGWEKYCKNIHNFEQDVSNLTLDEIKKLRINKMNQLDNLCDSFCNE